ncbi:chorismate mutase [Paracrocinitomix mangrovi]|uniref:chorismate mutase n=1 Tax=Paracrocinitomix mangrovi TaxID=2862509 RepID=UPI001C8E5C87|nr:chorismate mutase [Paracrocinitomix mangrovi]UKN02805.1 chorismate mutase [Paracrocinitomix mangrovi]
MTKISDISKPIIIAGPCSAETEDQVIQTAQKLKAGGKVDILRAGIWKPRTRPNSFEGIGEIGLEWLINAGKETGIPVITEVANAKHVELCLKAGFTKLWIGARTTVNPFAVQEIADALEGSNVEILVKNPINPDLNLWIGAIERFKNVGIEEVHAIHRGFSSVMSRKYRNDPMWEIPLALKRHFPDINLICDPSHITGNRDMIFDVAQKAMDLIYDGLMIETHIDPENAWSDADQQVTPNSLIEIIDNLVIRKESPEGIQVSEDLSELRSKINEIDAELIKLIAQRMKVAEEIGQYKKEHNITILQPKRWAEIKELQLENAERNGLSAKFVSKYLEAIHQESIRHQTAVMNKK